MNITAATTGLLWSSRKHMSQDWKIRERDKFVLLASYGSHRGDRLCIWFGYGARTIRTYG